MSVVCVQTKTMEDVKNDHRFNEKETLVLVQNVVEYDHILNGKFKGPGFGGITASSKENAWKQILDKVNAVATAPKTVQQLKKKMANIKQRGQQKLDLAKKTGGGPKAPSPTAVEKLWLSNSSSKPSVTGLGLGMMDTEDEMIQCDAADENLCNVGPSGDNISIPNSTENIRTEKLKEDRRNERKRRIDRLEEENLTLDNERIKKDIKRCEAETAKLIEETECLKLKKTLLTLKINKLSSSPSATNLLSSF